jgi:hypothetical protein
MDDFLGNIVGSPNGPEIDKAQWIDLIQNHPNLAPPQPRKGINPFTKEPMIIRPTPDVAHVVVNGKDVGTMSWAMDDSNLIHVYGEPDAVIPVAHELARTLGGRFKSAANEEQAP